MPLFEGSTVLENRPDIDFPRAVGRARATWAAIVLTGREIPVASPEQIHDNKSYKLVPRGGEARDDTAEGLRLVQCEPRHDV